MRSFVVWLCVAVLLGSCGVSDSAAPTVAAKPALTTSTTPAAATTAPTSTSTSVVDMTTTTLPAPSTTILTTTSSTIVVTTTTVAPSISGTGDQFSFLVSVDPVAGTIVADYASWYTGDDAQRACEQDGHDECDDFYTRLYYIRNTNPRLRTLQLRHDAVIAIGKEDVTSDLYYDCLEATLPIVEAAGLDWSRFSSIGGCLLDVEELASITSSFYHYAFPNTGLKLWLDEHNGQLSAIQSQYVP